MKGGLKVKIIEEPISGRDLENRIQTWVDMFDDPIQIQHISHTHAKGMHTVIIWYVIGLAVEAKGD